MKWLKKQDSSTFLTLTFDLDLQKNQQVYIKTNAHAKNLGQVHHNLPNIYLDICVEFDKRVS